MLYLIRKYSKCKTLRSEQIDRLPVFRTDPVTPDRSIIIRKLTAGLRRAGKSIFCLKAGNKIKIIKFFL